MARGNVDNYKVFYKGNVDDFVIFVDDVDVVKKWKADKSIPLAEVVSGFQVFITHRHGAQGILDTASQATLTNEFGTTKEEDVIIQILEKGEMQESENAERNGVKNETKGPRTNH